MNNVLRLRRLVFLGLGACIALLAATAWLSRGTGTFHLLAYGAYAALLLAASAAWRTVTVIDEGMTIRRGSLDRFFCPWSEIVAVERRQLGPFAVDQLQMREPVRRYIRHSSTAPPVVTWRPTSSKRVFIGLYDKDWRTGPIGAALTARGVSLKAIQPPGDPAVN